MGGLFYIAVAFTISDIPYHLNENHKLFGDSNVYGNEKWLNCIKDVGLEPHEKSVYRDGVPTLFIKKQFVDWSKFN